MVCPGSEDGNMDGAACGQPSQPQASSDSPKNPTGSKKRRKKNGTQRAGEQNHGQQNQIPQNDGVKDHGQQNQKNKNDRTEKGSAVKLLQTMAVWLEGANCPATDDSVLTGWSARYAEQFDQEGEPDQVDLAPVLGLPEGTAREELARIAEEQEEDLLKQLIG